MNLPIGLSRQTWLSALTAALSMLATSITYAQQAPTAARAPAMAQKSDKSDKADTPAFRSAFESYTPYSEEKITSWKEANDVTGRIGGWRAYAEEASKTEAAPPVAAGKPGVKP